MNGIDITQLGAAGAVVVVVFLFLRAMQQIVPLFMTAINGLREESALTRQESASTRAESIATRELIREVKDYMQHLNGDHKKVAVNRRQGGGDEPK